MSVPEPSIEISQSLTQECGTQSYGGQFNIRGSGLQKTFAGILAEEAKKQLASHPELIERCACRRFYLFYPHFFSNQAFSLILQPPPFLGKVIPTWSVSCRRLTPGPGYFEALCSNNVSISNFACGISFSDPTLWTGDSRNDRNCTSHADRHRVTRRTHARAGRPCLRDRLRHLLQVSVLRVGARWTGAERALGCDSGAT